MAAPRDPGQLLHRFLASVGRPVEAELYLSLFRAERPESFALIDVDAELVGTFADALAVELEFLGQLGLTPVIACDSADQARALEAWIADTVRAAVVSPDHADEAARQGVMPLVALPDGELGGLAARLATRKVILLGTATGLCPGGAAEPVSMVDVTIEADELAGALPADQRELLAQARDLIDAVAHPMTVAITTPIDLLRELFTVRGAGTLVRRGAAVSVHASLDSVDRSRLHALIEASFQRQLADNFWTRPIERIYVAGEYRGAAVVTPTRIGGYLSKLAVDLAARGDGIGRDLWRALSRDYPRLVWRSRAQNPITAWYQEQCDGMTKSGPWHIYWRGLDHHDIPVAVTLASDAPVDLG